MKNAFVVIFIVGLVFSAYADLILNPLEVHPNPSPYISDWENNPDIVIIRVTNTGAESESIYFRAELSKAGRGIIAQGASKPFVVEGNSTRTFHNTEFIDYEELEYEGEVRDQIERTGRIPEGEYSLCVTLFDIRGHNRGRECWNFPLPYPNPPELIYPTGNDTISNPYPLFQWTPTILAMGHSANYNLILVEVEAGQTPLQAIESATPVLFVQNLTTNQYPYGIADPVLVSGKRYAWRVTAVDSLGFPVSTNEGRSDIGEFYFVSSEESARMAPGETPPTAYNNTGTGTVRLSGVIIDYFTGEPVSGVRVVYRTVNRPGRTISGAVSVITTPSGITSQFSGTLTIPHNLANNLFIPSTTTFSQLNSALSGFDAVSSAISGGLSIGVYGVFGTTLPEGWTENTDSLWTLTDASGYFEFLNVKDSTYYSLRGYRNGYLPLLAVGNGYYQQGNIDSLELMITPNYGKLKGRVVKQGSGTPVVNCVVELWRQSSTGGSGGGTGTLFVPTARGVGSSITELPLTPTSGLDIGPLINLLSPAYTATTDTAGNYEFPHIEPGSYILKINNPRFRPYSSNQSVAGGIIRTLPTIQLAPFVGTIKGYVKKVVPTPQFNSWGFPIGVRWDTVAAANIEVGVWKNNSSLGIGLGGFTFQNNLYSNLIDSATNRGSITPLQPPSYNAQQGIIMSPANLQGAIQNIPDNIWNLDGQNLLSPRGPTQHPATPPVVPTRRTDSSGYFEFTNVEINDPLNMFDRYDVWAFRPGFRDAVRSARLASDGQVVTLTFVLEVGPGAIAGMVVDSATRGGLGNVKVELLKISSAGTGSTLRGTGTSQTQATPSQTVFSFANLFGSGALNNNIFANLPSFTPSGGVGVSSTGGGGSGIFSGLFNTVNTPFVQYDVVKETYTNDDGNYTLSPLDEGTYDAIRFSKPGYTTRIVQGPFAISFGAYIEENETLSIRGALVKGVIRDESGTPIYDVEVYSPDFDATFTSLADGSYRLYPVPKTSVRITYSKVGFAEKTDIVSVSGDSVVHNVTLSPIRGSLEITVIDSANMSLLSGALVSVTDDGSKLTNSQGVAHIDSVPAGEVEVTVIGPAVYDYVMQRFTITVEADSTVTDTVYLKRGGRLVGTVVDTSGVPIEGAEVFVDGSEDLIDTTGFDGAFTIKGVPAGTLTLKASKSGFITGSLEDIELSEGEIKSGLVITLRQAFVERIYGFEVTFDSVKALPNGNKNVTGYVVNIPANPAIKPKNSGQKLRFVNVELTSAGVPVSGKLQFVENSVDIKLFGFECALDTAGGLFAVWDNTFSRGVIPGNLKLPSAQMLSRIPGFEWADEKVIKPTAQFLRVALTSDGGYSGPFNLGLNATGTTVSWKGWGFTISVDYAKSKIDTVGLHYYGTIQIPSLPAFTFEDLTITKDFEVIKVDVKTTPPISIPLGIITVIDSQTVWDASGFKAKGSIRLQLGNTTNYGFNNLWISPDGDFMSVNITGGIGQSINLFGAQLTVQGLGFGTDTEGKKYFMFTGSLTLPNFSNPVNFSGLKIRQDGQITGSIYPNINSTFFGFLGVNINEVRFDKDPSNNKRYVGVYGNISIQIPGVGLQAGNFVFYEDGSFSVGEIGFSFSAGPVSASLQASWVGGVFSGGGSLDVPPQFSCAADFRYGGSTNWWIKIKAGVVIPIGPVTIVSVTGQLGRSGNVWTFGFGGSATVASASAAIRLDVEVVVQSGPVIQGTADLILFESLNLANATVTLDFPQHLFQGNVNFGFNKYGIQFTSWVGFKVKTGEYWYVGGGANINVLNLATVSTNIYAGHNYTGWLHTFPVYGHPDNQPLNGIHFDASAGANWNVAGCVGVNVSAYAYAVIDWYNHYYAGGMKFEGSAYFDIWIVGMSGSVNLSAALAYNGATDEVTFNGHAGLSLAAWVGCCGAGDACWWPPCLVCDCEWYQPWCCTPCGEKGCFSASIDIAYNGSSWSCNANWW